MNVPTLKKIPKLRKGNVNLSYRISGLKSAQKKPYWKGDEWTAIRLGFVLRA